ncbi:MAG: hypothetical protein HKN22_03660 [Bacteroidia bacterium]|nr:hypothetical protein [Bacteroidia bacterium]
MNKSTLTFIILTAFCINVNAQTSLENCNILIGENAVDTATVTDALKWADTKPICVKCEDENVYELNKLNFRMILQNPFRNKDFGTTEKGIPLLGRKLLEQAKPGDTVFLRSATYLDEEGNDVALPNIVFRIVE